MSPYISRGVISTQQIYKFIISTGVSWEKSEKLIQELAWRDYWQQVWIAKGDAIHTDLKNTQTPIYNHEIPKAIISASTGINAVDNAINELYETGYMHNHMRMYVASICCNIANSHWLAPAKWMYSHLLDGDLASNQLSWQWVAGAFSNKKYYANQDNINRFFLSSQKNTFLDVTFEELISLKTPDHLKHTIPFNTELILPNYLEPELKENKKTLIYNYYNLDFKWHKDEDYQRILLLEPSIFNKYPVKKKCIEFMINLSMNIRNLKVFVGEFSELEKKVNNVNIIYKEHPLNKHYRGKEESRDWLSSVTGYHKSFFAFWKKCKKELQN